jgi:hypothetical protein
VARTSADEITSLCSEGHCASLITRVGLNRAVPLEAAGIRVKSAGWGLGEFVEHRADVRHRDQDYVVLVGHGAGIAGDIQVLGLLSTTSTWCVTGIFDLRAYWDRTVTTSGRGYRRCYAPDSVGRSDKTRRGKAVFINSMFASSGSWVVARPTPSRRTSALRRPPRYPARSAERE